MKAVLLRCIVILGFFMLLIMPELSKQAAKDALGLWSGTIVPTLLPTMIISSILIEINAATYTARFLHPFTRRILGLSLEGTYCFMMAVLCGYPMGVKSICDMLKRNQISENQAKSLLAICAFPSPMFLIGFVYSELLRGGIPLWGFLVCIYAPAILLKTIADMIACFHHNANETVFYFHKSKHSSFQLIFKNLPAFARRFQWNRTHLIRYDQIDDIVLSCSFMQLKIGCYMMLFSILGAWILTALKTAPGLALLLGGCCEMTIGITRLFQYVSFRQGLPVMCFFLCFGGLSTVAQTKTVMRDSSLQISEYLNYKLLHGIISGGLMWLFLKLNIF